MDPIKELERLMAAMDGSMQKHYEELRKVGETEGPHIAPDGKLWMCMACGKKVKDRYGEERGWDESCMLNSVLVDSTPR